MTNYLRDSQLSRLSDFVTATMGLNFPRGRWGDLERQTHSAAKEFGYNDTEVFVAWLLSTPLTQEQIEKLAAQLTISETHFWREPRVFEALRDSILPELVRARAKGDRQLRLWSAGCATGEEVYSIAFVLREIVPARDDWRITLLATDINPQMLRRAALGVYGDWSFRNTPPEIKDRYFLRRNDGKYEVLPEIRAMVTFANLNLAEDIYPSLLTNTNGMDVIFCRNVLMYFDMGHAQRVGQRFYRSLAQGGWLVVAATELSDKRFPQFATVQYPGAFIYRRAAPPSVTPSVTPAPDAVTTTPPMPASNPAANGGRRPVTASLTGSRTRPLRTKTAALNPAKPEVPPDLAPAVRELANQGKLDEALTACEQAIAANKLDPQLHYLHAIILQEQRREVEARAAFLNALYLDPSFVLAHFGMGTLAQRQGNRPAAKKSFKNALALLSSFSADDILPEAEGLTAGRLREIVRATLQTGTLSL